MLSACSNALPLIPPRKRAPRKRGQVIIDGALLVRHEGSRMRVLVVGISDIADDDYFEAPQY
jgi:hypothetical protein